MLGGILLGRRGDQVEAAAWALKEALRVDRRRTRAALGLGLLAPLSGTHAVRSEEALGYPTGSSWLSSALSGPETGFGSHSAPSRVPLCPQGPAQSLVQREPCSTWLN